MTFDPVEFFKSLSDAQKRSCVLALELARHKLDDKQYDDVRDKGHKRIELIRECVMGQHEKATLQEARLLLLLLRDLTFNILESDFRDQEPEMNFVKSQDQVPELETVMTEYWDLVWRYRWDCKRELNVPIYPTPIHAPEGSLPSNQVCQTWSVVLLGTYYDLDTGTGCEIFRVQRGTERYYTDDEGGQLFREEVGT